jgi:LmbE family N-acetylglucosaminyl deacetylase
VLGPRVRRGRFSLSLLAALALAAPAAAQERGANALGDAVQFLGVNTRVLVIGAHPDDEDTFLISWLSRGRGVETAYLSLSRGDGGQNLIGNELGEALGVIRTEELLAARRVDGAKQYFTRAFDFGFSKDTIDTYAHWPRDSILGDVIRVVRAFRPHVIVAVFGGTPRDGHGHHQVSGLLARTAYDVAADTARYPVTAYGPGWTPLKFYRARYFAPETATLRFDAGEYSLLLGRSFAEIAGESRSQHKSQGFGAPQRKGPVIDLLTREATRVNAGVAATSEQSLFDGMDTTWARFRSARVSPGARAMIDSLPLAFAEARTAFDPLRPEGLLPALGRATGLLSRLASMSHFTDWDLLESLRIAAERARHALQLASGIEVDALAPHEVYPPGTARRVIVSVYNRGRVDATLLHEPVFVTRNRPNDATRMRDVAYDDSARALPAGSVLVDTSAAEIVRVDEPWWLRTPRAGALFTQPAATVPAGDVSAGPEAIVRVELRGVSTPLFIATPVQFREIDAVKGEIRRQVVGAPGITVTMDQERQFAPANTEFVRDFTVTIRSVDEAPRDVTVRLTLPAGLRADSASRSARLGGYGATQTVTFRVRGRLGPGMHQVAAVAESGGRQFTRGYQLIDYDHIRRQRIYHDAATTISAVEMRVPATLRVAYVPGVGDNVAPALMQLGIPVTVVPASEVGRADLTPYTTVVIGPRAYEAHPELVAANTQLFDFVRRGGTMVVQYGQYEMTQPGAMPYPITLARPADRVTHEEAPVTIDAPNDRLLQSPNRIGASDFVGWVQERSLYMPRTFDEHYRALLSMNDPTEPPNRGAILATQLGQGTYIYTTLSLFRQLPAGVPGGARIFLNLLSANIGTNVNP